MRSLRAYTLYISLWLLLAALLCQALPAVPTALLIPLCALGGVASWLDAVEAWPFDV